MSSFGTQLFGFTNHLKMYTIFSHVVKFTVYIIYFRHEYANDIWIFKGKSYCTIGKM